MMNHGSMLHSGSLVELLYFQPAWSVQRETLFLVSLVRKNPNGRLEEDGRHNKPLHTRSFEFRAFHMPFSQ